MMERVSLREGVNFVDLCLTLLNGRLACDREGDRTDV